MEKNLLIKGEALQASVVSALAAEQFLNEHYQFRRNQLNGKVEFSTKPAEGQEPTFRPLTQLYAQVLYELREQKAPYWFNNDEVARIQQLNQGYMEQKDIVEIIKVCFRKPEEGEHVKSMNTSELLSVIQGRYPTIPDTMSTRVRLGQAMKLLEYDSTSRGHTSYYKAVPLKAA